MAITGFRPKSMRNSDSAGGSEVIEAWTGPEYTAMCKLYQGGKEEAGRGYVRKH
jgi:hypothetical protein